MADVRYTIADLGTLPGFVISSAEAINEAGQIIGSLRAEDANDSDAFWWVEGHMHCVGKFSLQGINNRGEAVGTQFKRTGKQYVFRAIYFQSGSFSPLPVNKSLFSWANAINDSGQVAGHVMSRMEQIRVPEDIKADGCIWQSGKRRDLPLPPDYRASEAVAINDQGIVVGTARRLQQNVPTMEQAVLWQGDEVTLLGSLPGFAESEEVAINNRRQVLVRAISRSHSVNVLNYRFSSRNFLWHDGSKQEIEGRSAYALNDCGQIVGSDGTINMETGEGRLWAFLWQDGERFDLNDLIPPNSGWELTHARGINNHGQIVGSGVHNGKERAFLLTPIAH